MELTGVSNNVRASVPWEFRGVGSRGWRRVRGGTESSNVVYQE